MEIYTRIKGYEHYAVSNFGNVLNIRTLRFLRLWLNNSGYYQVMLCKNGLVKVFKLHRLIGEHFIDNPENLPVIDHIDGNRTNNEISNLRWATHQTNSRNSKKRKSTTSNFKGVSLNKKRNKWVAQIQVNYKTIFLGYFSTEIEAGKAYNEYVIENGLEDFPLNEI